MQVKRIVTLIFLLAAAAGALLYGSLFHRVTIEVEKQREITIAIPTLLEPGDMFFQPQGFDVPPGFDGPQGMPPGDGHMQSPPPPPMMPGIKMETVTEKYVEAQEEPEYAMVFEVTIGGITRLANGQLKRTYSGKPPALCPT